MFDRMRTGKYAPVLTGTDKGLRLDIVSADVVMMGNKPKIRFPMVLWGAQRETREDERTGVKRVMTWAEFATTFRLLDDKGKLYGEMSTGNPGMRNDYPERLIAEFPPQIVLGQYELDPVPATVSVMEMLVSVRSHSPSGGDISAQYTWKIPVPDDWRLKPGETWEGATETTRSEEEKIRSGGRRPHSREEVRLEPGRRRAVTHTTAKWPASRWRAQVPRLVEQCHVESRGSPRGRARRGPPGARPARARSARPARAPPVRRPAPPRARGTAPPGDRPPRPQRPPATPACRRAAPGRRRPVDPTTTSSTPARSTPTGRSGTGTARCQMTRPRTSRQARVGRSSCMPAIHARAPPAVGGVGCWRGSSVSQRTSPRTGSRARSADRSSRPSGTSATGPQGSAGPVKGSGAATRKRTVPSCRSSPVSTPASDAASTVTPESAMCSRRVRGGTNDQRCRPVSASTARMPRRSRPKSSTCSAEMASGSSAAPSCGWNQRGVASCDAVPEEAVTRRGERPSVGRRGPTAQGGPVDPLLPVPAEQVHPSVGQQHHAGVGGRRASPDPARRAPG